MPPHVALLGEATSADITVEEQHSFVHEHVSLEVADLTELLVTVDDPAPVTRIELFACKVELLDLLVPMIWYVFECIVDHAFFLGSIKHVAVLQKLTRATKQLLKGILFVLLLLHFLLAHQVFFA